MNPGIGDRGKVDKNCMAADVAVFKCRKPIDAANYIGIAYDYTKGVNRAATLLILIFFNPKFF